MAESTPTSFIISQLEACIAANFSATEIGTLSEALLAAPADLAPAYAELLEALTNYALQLRDGAVKQSSSTATLFRESAALLQEADTREQPSANVAEAIHSLLERLDLEASGGFDAAEAGELPIDATSSENAAQTFRMRQAMHRIRCLIDSIRPSTMSPTPLSAQEALRRAQLGILQALEADLPIEPSVSVRVVGDAIAGKFTDINLKVSVSSDQQVHSSCIHALTTLGSHVITSLPQEGGIEVDIAATGETIAMNLSVPSELPTPDKLIHVAKEAGFVRTSALLGSDELRQFMLLPAKRDSGWLKEVSSLFAVLNHYGAEVKFQSATNGTQVNLTIPSTMRECAVAVFALGNSLYAFAVQDIEKVEVRNPTTHSNIDREPSFDDSDNIFKLSSERSAHADVCVTLTRPPNTHQIYFTSQEPDGYVVSLDSPVTPHGCVQLRDGRVVNLISIWDLDGFADARRSKTSIKPALRLIAFNDCELPMQLSSNEIAVEMVSTELAAISAMQENRPHGLLVAKQSPISHPALFNFAKDRRINVLTEVRSQNQKDEPGELVATVQVQTSQDLRASLRAESLARRSS
ncbi:MAG: hypothetical protein F4W90_01405 [Gammaproteobacteria bacterium]|nr:hypothetical protein [Gammaproteobacteria bacterium]